MNTPTFEQKKINVEDHRPTDNQQLRELFTLPPIRSSASTALAVPEMPPQETVTGDQEVDAVLWLQKVVDTGNRELIDKALEAAKRIKTPMKTLEDRYATYVRLANAGNVFAVLFATMDFGELEKQAQKAIQRAGLRHEAQSRFWDVDTLFANTPAEDACAQALHRAKRSKYGGYDDSVAKARFSKRPELTPATIDDCLYVIGYWDRLYRLRHAAVDHAGDPLEQASAHDYYCFAMMANIRPRDKQEAMRAFEYLQEDGRDQWNEAPAIYRNLIASGWGVGAKIEDSDSTNESTACGTNLQNTQQNIPKIIPATSPWVRSEDALPPTGVKVIWCDIDENGEAFDIGTATRNREDDWEGVKCYWMRMPALPGDGQNCECAPVAQEPLTPDALADKCEAWLRAGGASNVVDAYEAGYRDAESAPVAAPPSVPDRWDAERWRQLDKMACDPEFVLDVNAGSWAMLREMIEATLAAKEGT